jgi:hypothetical protein
MRTRERNNRDEKERQRESEREEQRDREGTPSQARGVKKSALGDRCNKVSQLFLC